MPQEHLGKLNMTRRLESSLVLALGVAALASNGFAQSAPPGEEVTLETVVVTAEKREESLQKTAIAITALSGAELQNQARNTLEDVLRIVPGVQVRVQSNPTNSIITIRGIQPAANTDPTVNVNIDGIYQSDQGTPQFDLARVEILKGPQGTLYGRNATGGVVNIITNDPSREFAASATAQAGNYSAARGEATLNIPIGDRVSSRFAGVYSKRDGYYSNGALDQDVLAGRLKLLFKPTDNVSALLAGEVDRMRGVGSATIPSDATSPVDQRSDPWYTPDPAGAYKGDRWSVYGVLNWNLPRTVLTIQPGYYRFKNLQDNELTGADQGLVMGGGESVQKSLEVRLSQADSSRIKWQLGYFLLRQTNTSLFESPLVNVPSRSTGATGLFQPFLTTAQALATPGLAYRRPVGGTGLSRPIAENNAWAVFGQSTVPLAETFRLTTGIRYSVDDKSRRNRVFNALGVESSPYAAPVLSNAALTPCVAGSSISACLAEAHSHATTWKVGAEFDVAPASMLYADVAKGFKSGGLNILPVPSGYGLDFAPEKVLAYEAGSKNRFLDNRLQVNGDLYYYDYTDKQIVVVGPPIAPNPFPSTPTVNAGKATVYGAEVASEWLVTPGNRISASVAYNKTTVDEVPNILTAGVLQFGYLLNEPLPNAPLWTEMLGYEHIINFASAGSLSFGGAARFFSSYHTDVNYSRPDSIQHDYQLFDLNTTYTTPGGRWKVNGFVSNLANTAVRSSAFGATRMMLEPPRLWGVSLSANW
jgi:iron complex outermembrane receptor protein